MIETKVDGLRSDLSEVKNDVHSLNAKIDGLDSKFAARWVQTAVAFVIGIVMTAVIGALIALVVIKPGDSTTVTTSTTDQTPSNGKTTTDTTQTTTVP